MQEVLGWLSLWCGVAGVASGLAAWRSWPRGERTRCPGPPVRHWVIRLVDPCRWLWRGRCWYQLTGHLDSSDKSEISAITCPECGRTHPAARLRRDGRRFRTEALSSGLLTLAIGLWLWPAIANGGLIRPVPTLALVMLNGAAPNLVGQVVDDEVRRRLNNGEVDDWSASILSQRYAAQLRDDDEKWNATAAREHLQTLWPHSRPVLEQMLTAGDAQARVVAADLLRQHCDEPSQPLLDACIKDLRDDSQLVDHFIGGGYNARAAAKYLVTWALEAKSQLEQGMHSGDRQQRLLAAAIVSYSGMTSLAHQAAPILIEHLRDNNVGGDAKIAAPALYRLGEPAIGYLQEHIDSEDEQLRLSALAIIERIQRSDEPLSAMTHHMPRITRVVSDPLQDMPLWPADLCWPR